MLDFMGKKILKAASLPRISQAAPVARRPEWASALESFVVTIDAGIQPLKHSNEVVYNKHISAVTKTEAAIPVPSHAEADAALISKFCWIFIPDSVSLLAVIRCVKH